MNHMKFFTISYDRDPGYCAVNQTPREMKLSHFSYSGRRLGKRHDPRLQFTMSRHAPGRVVPDLIRQLIGQFLVSARAAEVLKSVVNVKTEYLPVSLLDHKGRMAASDLVLVNVLGFYDCVDRLKTKGVPSVDLDACEQQTKKKKLLPRHQTQVPDLAENEYIEINRLVLHPRRTPKDANLFRLGSLITTLIFREDVVAALKKSGMTGATFIPTGKLVEIM